MRADEPQETGGHAGYLRPGTDLAGGRYRVEVLLGVWGIRALYAVTETGSGRAAMAAEFVLTNSTNAEQRVRHLMGLEHPILPVIREFSLGDGLLYLVFNLADGTTLDRALAAEATGRVDERQVISWGLQLADGLTFLRSQQPPLVVADLAPSAVLVTPYNRLKVVGLGAMLGLYSTAEMVGALEPGYVAPEVYQGRVDGQGDIYAAGALLHRALSGSNPAVHAPGFLPPVRSLRPGVFPGLADAITRAVAPLPEDRWPDAASFAAALREADAATDEAEQAQAAAARPTTPSMNAGAAQEPDAGAGTAQAEASTDEPESLSPIAAEAPEDWPAPPAERKLTPIPHAFMLPPDLTLPEAGAESDAAVSPTSGVPAPDMPATEEPVEETQSAEVPATETPAEETRADSQPDPHRGAAPAPVAPPVVTGAALTSAAPIPARRQRRPGVFGRLFGRRSSR
jgi:Protein kinase domain